MNHRVYPTALPSDVRDSFSSFLLTPDHQVVFSDPSRMKVSPFLCVHSRVTSLLTRDLWCSALQSSFLKGKSLNICQDTSESVQVPPKISPLPQPTTENWRIRKLMCKGLLPVLLLSPASLFPLTSTCTFFRSLPSYLLTASCMGQRVLAASAYSSNTQIPRTKPRQIRDTRQTFKANRELLVWKVGRQFLSVR